MNCLDLIAVASPPWGSWSVLNFVCRCWGCRFQFPSKEINYIRRKYMEQTIQTMDEYTSLYDKPKRGNGKPSGS